MNARTLTSSRSARVLRSRSSCRPGWSLVTEWRRSPRRRNRPRPRSRATDGPPAAVRLPWRRLPAAARLFLLSVPGNAAARPTPRPRGFEVAPLLAPARVPVRVRVSVRPPRPAHDHGTSQRITGVFPLKSRNPQRSCRPLRAGDACPPAQGPHWRHPHISLRHWLYYSQRAAGPLSGLARIVLDVATGRRSYCRGSPVSWSFVTPPPGRPQALLDVFRAGPISEVFSTCRAGTSRRPRLAAVQVGVLNLPRLFCVNRSWQARS